MQALEGIKVLEMAVWAVGPAAGAVLGDWGADVIKIEDPSGGDPMRALETLVGAPAPQKHSVFDVDNRNKRSIALDLKQEPGRKIAHELVKSADVFITNYRSAALKRLRMDYMSLSKLNPRLIYAFLSGYGEKGPEKDKAGYDNGAYWARGGFLVQLGADGTPPVLQYAGLGDQPTGLHAAGGIALALFVRERTGIGQKVSLSLLRSAVWTQSLNIASAMEYGELPRINRKAVANPLLNCYQAKDGKWLMLLMLQPDRYWPDFCKATGLEKLEKDPKFCSISARAVNSAELISILDQVFATKTRDEWVMIFKGYDFLWDPGNTFADLVQDPQALANDAFFTMEHPNKGLVKVPASPIDFSMCSISIRRHPPELGEHTEEILLEMGYTWGDITKLKDSKVIL